MSKQVAGVVGFVSALLILTMIGCGNQPVGPTTVTARIRDLCGVNGGDEDTMRSALIAIDALRDEGAPKAEVIIGFIQACEAAPSAEKEAWFNCSIEMVNHVYTH